MPVHLLAARATAHDNIVSIWPHLLNQGDYFNNRPLHFAAASKNPSGEQMIKMIQGGGDVASINTNGATFVHVLFKRVEPEQLPLFLSLFRYLASVDFNFSCRDYHGRTPWHMLFQRDLNLNENSAVILEHILHLLKPDIDCVDNFGFSIRSYAVKKQLNFASFPGFPSYLFQELFLTPEKNTVDFRSLLAEASPNWHACIEEILANGQAAWIDNNGDTALIALVKTWNYDHDERLLADCIQRIVSQGAEVHMRDRVGDTALAVAMRRGLRPAVTTLFSLGASLYSRNYQKVGILKQANRSLLQAAYVGADGLHSMIWSCIVFFTDVCDTATHEYREWGASWVGLEDLDRAWSEFQETRSVRRSPLGLNSLRRNLKDAWPL
jgi:ankyrin repeat protein